MKKAFNMRLDTEVKEKLEVIVKKESQKTGYKVTLSQVIEKALRKFIDEYK